MEDDDGGWSFFETRVEWKEEEREWGEVRGQEEEEKMVRGEEEEEGQQKIIVKYLIYRFLIVTIKL